MSNITTTTKSSLLAIMAEQYNLEPGKFHQVLKQTAFSKCRSDEEFMAMCVVANQYGLNPLTKEIYAFPSRDGAVIPIVGIDGWCRIINQHHMFDGVEFEESEGVCTCIIYRKDRNHPIKVTEWLCECNTNTAPWKSHPRRMLRHRALIQAARLAFGFTGIYDRDEVLQEQGEQKGTSEQTSRSLLEKVHGQTEKLIQSESEKLEPIPEPRIPDEVPTYEEFCQESNDLIPPVEVM